MSRRHPHPWTTATGAIALAAALGLLGAAPDVADETPPAVAETPPLPAATAREGQGLVYQKGQFVGPAACASANCHGNPEPSQTYAVLQNEFSTWFHQDVHRRAGEVLTSDRSALIARNLKLRAAAPESRACLDCHATVAPRSAQLELTDGISCETCHGPAGGWLARHNEAGWSHADSVAAGMADLRQPRRRADLCLACHQGEPSRQVDHELLAAGHPELVFELDGYSASMPPHWRSAAERAAAARPEPPPALEGAPAWAVGQLEAFRAGLRLLRWRAAADRWPEFAELSCDTCHHDLATGQWRQVRGFRYRAGLPSWSPARWAALRQVVARFAPAEAAALDGEVEALAREVAPLRSGEDPRSICDRALALADRAAASVAAASWDRRTVHQLLAALAADRAFLAAADRQSAEQVALAIQALAAHSAEHWPAAGGSRLNARVRELFDELDDPYRYDPRRFAEVLTRLAADLSPEAP